MHVMITGSSGLIGSALGKRLAAEGHQITRLIRRTPRPGEVSWDPASGVISPAVLRGVDAVVNLAGAGIGDHRWTAAYKQTLRDSRIRGTTALATAIAAADDGPPALLSGSAIGYYGSRGDETLDESSAPGSGFLAELCVEWEAATAAASEAGARVAHLRTGIVLAGNGGALRKQLPLFRFGLGGRLGSGRQWQSWIAIDDHVAAMMHLLNGDLSGAVNLTSPNPVRQVDFARALGRALHRPAFVPVPAIGPRLALGRELADEVVLAGAKVIPAALAGDGFAFRFPDLDAALAIALTHRG